MHLIGQNIPQNSPQNLGKLCQILMQSYDARVRRCIALECLHLATPFYLNMRELSDLSVAALMQKAELSGSQNLFKIDNSFNIHISGTVIPSGDSKKKRMSIRNWELKRFATSN